VHHVATARFVRNHTIKVLFTDPTLDLCTTAEDVQSTVA
jgi:hypothetical protein